MKNNVKITLSKIYKIYHTGGTIIFWAETATVIYRDHR